jgi:hypothetical protein
MLFYRYSLTYSALLSYERVVSSDFIDESK